MTIQFQGHIESVSRDISSTIKVHVVTNHSVCPEGITVNVPEDQKSEWLVGRIVQITMHAYEALTP
jgi:hypothetical protein